MDRSSVSQRKSAQKWIEVSDQRCRRKEPRVSVLMATYNHAAYLAEAIQGVISQTTNFGFELIIGEDCSSDATQQVALLYQQVYPEIIRVLISRYNVGGKENFFRMLKSSRGGLIALCDGDDYWIDTEKLSKQVRVLEGNPKLDLTFHSTYVRNFATEDLVGPLCNVRKDSGVVPVEDVIAGDGNFMPTASVMVRRAALDNVPTGMLESAPVGDFVVQVYGSLKGGAYYINEPMSVYRRGHAGSWSTSIKNMDRLVAYELAFAKLVNEMESNIQAHGRSFTELIYRHYVPRFQNASAGGDDLLKGIYGKLLLPKMPEFSYSRKAIIWASRLRWIAALMTTRFGVMTRLRRARKALFGSIVALALGK